MRRSIDVTRGIEMVVEWPWCLKELRIIYQVMLRPKGVYICKQFCHIIEARDAHCTTKDSSVMAA